MVVIPAHRFELCFFFYLLLQFLASCVCFAKKFNLRCLSRLNLFADLLLPGGEKCAKQFQSARDFGHWKVRYSGIKVVGLNICLFSALFWSLKTVVRVLTGIIFFRFFYSKIKVKGNNPLRLRKNVMFCILVWLLYDQRCHFESLSIQIIHKIGNSPYKNAIKNNKYFLSYWSCLSHNHLHLL